MKFINIVHEKNIAKLKVFNKTLIRKEKFISSQHYFILRFRVAKKIIRPDYINTYIIGFKIHEKKIDVIKKILPYAKNKDFIYFCMHSGEFYYLCNIIKIHFEEFKDTVIITNFGYNRQVFELLDFEKQWLDEHFIVVPQLWLFSLGVWCKADGTLLSKVELSHEKGWIVNGKLQKKGKNYFSVAECISHFLLKKKFVHNIKLPTNVTKEKSVLLIPESQFNGNLSVDFCKELCRCLCEQGYKIYLNTKGTAYDQLLDFQVEKVFASYKETFELAAKCSALISVRCGLVENLQKLSDSKLRFFIIYNKIFYPHYTYFKNFHKWFLQVYSLNHINFSTSFDEFADWKNENTITDQILEVLK